MDEKDSRTFKHLVPEKTSMRDVDKKFDQGQEVTDFPGHSLAWHGTDDCADQLCCDTIQRIKLYQRVFGKLGQKQPYPFCDLGGQPQGLAKLSVIQGGTQMLNKLIEEIIM